MFAVCNSYEMVRVIVGSSVTHRGIFLRGSEVMGFNLGVYSAKFSAPSSGETRSNLEKVLEAQK